MLNMNDPTIMVGIKYIAKLVPFGIIAIAKIEKMIAEIIENNTAIPVLIVVNEASSIDLISLKLLIQTNFLIFLITRQ